MVSQRRTTTLAHARHLQEDSRDDGNTTPSKLPQSLGAGCERRLLPLPPKRDGPDAALVPFELDRAPPKKWSRPIKRIANGLW